VPESRLGLREGEHAGELAVDKKSSQKEHTSFGGSPHPEQFLVVARLRAEVSELFSGGNRAPDRAGKVIESDLQLRCSHAFMRRHEALSEQIAAGVVAEQHHVSVAVVLSDVLAQRVERLGDVAGRGEYG